MSLTQTAPAAASTLATVGGAVFAGHFAGASSAVRAQYITITVYRHTASHTAETVAWTHTQKVKVSQSQSGDYSIPLPSLIADDYCWKVSIRDSSGTTSASAADRPVFTISSTAPVLSAPKPGDLSSRRTLNGVRFSATWSDAQSYRPIRGHIQMQPAGGLWSAGETVWDADFDIPVGSAGPFTYFSGSGLFAAGDYEWRMYAVNEIGEASNTITQTITLSVGFEAVPGTVTGYHTAERKPARWRIVIKDIKAPPTATVVVPFESTYKYKVESWDHDTGFEAPAFDDSAWSTGQGGFGYNDATSTNPGVVATRKLNGAQINTQWVDPTPFSATNASNKSDLTIRKSITWPAESPAMKITYGIDDEVWFYVDGVEVGHFLNDGPSQRTDFSLTVAAPSPGSHVVAVRARNKSTTLPVWSNSAFFDMQIESLLVTGATYSGGAPTIVHQVQAVVPPGGTNMYFDPTNVATYGSGTGFTPTSGNYLIILGNRRGGGVPAASYGGWTVTDAASNGTGAWIAWKISDGTETFAPGQLLTSYPTMSNQSWYVVEVTPTDSITHGLHEGTGTTMVGPTVSNTSGYSEISFAVLSGDSGSDQTVTPNGGFSSIFHTGDGAGHNPVTMATLSETSASGSTTAGATWSQSNPYSVAVITLRGGNLTWSSGIPALYDRGPGNLAAIVENANNVRVAEYYNAGGTIGFTLPTLDPQCPNINPYESHWSFQMYRGEGWKELSAGLIIDYDTTDTDTIFYGADYLGILGLMYDERFNPKNAADAEASLWPTDPALHPDTTTSGSKYTAVRIDAIVTDQLERAVNAPNSPLGFISVGSIAAMTETVTIFATLAQRLPFIVGLLDSHRAGTGHRTRLHVKHNEDDTYEFEVLENPGNLRPDLKMQYGGLIQGYRAVPFGNFATRVLALGRQTNGLELSYAIANTPIPTGETDADFNVKRYGNIPQINMWQDIADANDLKRRAANYAAKVGAIGKQMGLGIKTNLLTVKDDWDIADSIPVDIRRGKLDTTTMGDGYWTVWGWELDINQNTEVRPVLSLLPYIAEASADSETAAASTVDTTPAFVYTNADPSTTDVPTGPGTWVNSESGHVWTVDPTTGFWTDETAAGGPEFPRMRPVPTPGIYDEGAEGEQGIPGPQGPRGLPGVPGLGIPGFDGEDGEQGIPGRQGVDGATGATGATGAAGAQGIPGVTIPGQDGEDWDGMVIPGNTGPTGATGATGSTGAQGATGNIGSPGVPGADGEDWDGMFIPNLELPNALKYLATLDNTGPSDVLPILLASRGGASSTAITAAGKAILDDTDAAAQRTTLGLATVAATGSHADLTGVTSDQHHARAHDHSNASDTVDLLPATVHISSTTDLSLASTGHGLQVGDTAGNNMAMDNNELMARNNGAAGTMNLQADGGTISMFTSTPGALTIAGTRPIAVVHSFKGTIASGTATLTLDPVGAAVAGNGIIMPWAGKIIAVSARTASARTAGSATSTATIGGASKTAASSVIDATNPNGKATAVADASADTFTANSALRAQVVTSGFTPTSNAIQVDVYVIYDAVG